MAAILSRERWVNSSGAEVETFSDNDNGENKINSMAANALAHFAARPSAAMVLNWIGWTGFVCHEERPQLLLLNAENIRKL